MPPENRVLERFDAVARSFSRDDRIALVHDLDADGVSSGALAYLGIRLLRGKAPDIVITQPHKTVELLPGTLAAMRAARTGKLVIVDFAADQAGGSLSEAERIVGQVLVIDHHKDYGFRGNGRSFVIKPQLFSEIEPSRYPCAKLVYDLFSRHVGLSPHSWIACVGLMGDNQLEQWKGFVEESARIHGTSVSELWKVVESISAVEVLAPAKLGETLLLLADSGSPKDVLRSPLAKYRVRLGKKVAALYRKFRAKKEVHKGLGLVWFEFRARESIKSALINKVSNGLYPRWTVIVVQDRGNGFVDFSARRQDFRVKTNDLLENAVRGFENAGAGGHVPASAGRILKKDLPEFRKRIMDYLARGTFSQ